MSREIEIKFQIAEEELSIFKGWVSENAKFIKKTKQFEYYLDNPSSPYKFVNNEGLIDSERFLRVRFSESGDSVCLKIFKINPETGSSLNVDEVEYSVSDGNESLKLFEYLGYTDKTKVNKEREIYLYNEFEISFDNVEGLGVFVEVELKKQIEGDIKKGFEMIYSFLKSAGINKITIQKRGYVAMLWNKKHDFGKIKEL